MIKKQVTSTDTNLACWLGWWRKGVVCVGGILSTWRKSTWASRWRPDLLTHDTKDRTRVVLVI